MTLPQALNRSHLLIFSLTVATLVFVNSTQAATAKASKALRKPATKVSRAAPAVLELSRRAYGRLRSLSFSTQREVVSERGKDLTQTRFSYAAPNRFLLISTGIDGTMRTLSNGQTLFDIKGDEYMTLPMPPQKLGRLGLMQYRVAGIVTPFLAGANAFAAPWGEPPTEYVTSSATFNGQPVERVVLRIPGRGNQTLTLLFGKADHLLRRARFQAGTELSVTETYSDIKMNPVIPASTFVFTPAAGAKLHGEGDQGYWSSEIKVGAAPPAFDVEDTAGNKINLASLKGKVVLLDFWATWCMPCRTELPFVKAAYSRLHDKGFEIVGISFDKEKEALDAYVKTNGMTWPQVFDGKMFESAANTHFQLRGIPFTLLLGRDGKIAAINPRMLLLEAEVEKALAQNP